MATAIHTPSLHFRGTQPAIVSLPKAEFELNGFALDPRFYDDEEDYLDEYIMDLGADSESLLELESTSSSSNERAAPITPPPQFPPPPPDVPFSHADWTHSVTHVLACLSLLAVFWRLGAR
ncbi:hypothetical protein FB45DRAFT_1069568, partial [Roridomyces roridus]